MVEWADRIPMMILPECENGYSEDLERCPCGSSVFRIQAETVKQDDKEWEFNWWQLCAVCGGPQGGFTQRINMKTGKDVLLRIDRKGIKYYLKKD